MEITPDVTKLGGIAAQTLLYPMQPQKLTSEELAAIAGGQFGYDTLAGHLYPDMVKVAERFGGGRFDAAMKAKLQTWLSGWVHPPESYVIHHPFYASGQWWRVFRTTMFVEQDLEEAKDAARVMTPDELEARYAFVLGPGARERYESHHAWWQVVLGTIRMGSWHLAIYSPRYQAFVSPYILDAEENGGKAIRQLRAEWPKPVFRLYMAPEDRTFGTFNFSHMINSGAFIEVLGTMNSAPPFGQRWGTGVVQTNPGNNQGWLISGLIHAWDDGRGIPHRRMYLVSDAPDVDGVAMDGPDPFRLAQALHGATGWLPKGVPVELMAPERIDDLVASHGTSLAGPTGDTPLLVPKSVFLDAIMVHPGLVPVYGRVISLMV